MGLICNGRMVFFFVGDVPAVFKNIFEENKTNGKILGSKEKYLGAIIRLLDPPFKGK